MVDVSCVADDAGGVVFGAEVEREAEAGSNAGQYADVACVGDDSGDDGATWSAPEVELDDDVAEGLHAPVEGAIVHHAASRLRRVFDADTAG